ncbi:MAG TPA: hypothetical protein PLP17_04925, partial [Oligoflexia bacterium]|nr:hypothetical protein [Oligoflexia bacterium]
KLKPYILIMLLAGLACGMFGLGLPNHYYQVVLAALTIALGYHRGWFAACAGGARWILGLLNVCVLSLLFKLVIGGGVRNPFFWISYPVIVKSPPAEKTGLLPAMPDLQIGWEPTTLAQWSFDLTIVQTFLLLITLVGALFEFQPFISFTAFLLVVVSLPALVSFEWSWVFPAIVCAAVGLYLQSSAAHERELDA